MNKRKGEQAKCVDCGSPYVRKSRNQKRCTACGLKKGSVRK